jgi:signal transduction histidine kinase/CheY-like chemotaxis protein
VNDGIQKGLSRTVLVLLALSASNLAPVQAGEFFTARDHGSTGQHWSMARADDGRIFIGTDQLVEFDGIRWTHHELPAAGGVRALAFDRNGRLWIAGRNAVGTFDHSTGRGEYRSAKGLLEPTVREFGDVWGLFPHRDGVVLVAERSVVLFSLGTARVWQLPTERRLLPFVSDGRLYIAQPGTGLWRLAGNNLEPVATPDSLNREEICWAEKIEDPERWLAVTPRGLVGGPAVAQFAEEHLNPILRRAAPTHVERLGDGTIAIATWLAGVIICDESGRLMHHLTPRTGLPGTSVVATFPQADGSLWVVAASGVGRVVPGQLALPHDAAAGFVPSRWHSTVETENGVLLATDAGLWSINNNLELTLRTSRIFHQLLSFPDLLLSGGFLGLHSISADRVALLHHETNDVTAAVVSRALPDRLYFATGQSLRWGTVSQSAFALAPAQLKLDDSVRHLTEDHEGDLWAITATGRVLRIRHWERDTNSFIVEAVKGAGNDWVASGVRDLLPAGNRIYAHAGGKLWLLDGPDTPPRPIPSLSNTQVLATAADPAEDSVWALVRPHGHAQVSATLVRLEPRADHEVVARPIHRLARRIVGEPTSLHTTVDAQGKRWLWVAGTHGSVRVPAEELLSSAPPASFAVRNIQVRDRHQVFELNPAPSVVLKSATRAVTFTWMNGGALAGDFAFESRLLGADDTWRADGLTWTREFTGLAAGSYTFELRTLDALGQPGPVQRVAFTLPAPWYLTSTAYTSYALTVIGLGWGAFALRTRRIRRRAEELEAVVQCRTEQLARANSEKTRFLARMNHEIRNPLNGLVGVIGILENTPLAQREAKLFGVLRACADQLNGVVEGVLDFASVEAGRIVIRERAFAVAETLGLVRQVFLAESLRTATEVDLQIDPALPPVLVGDPDRIRQVLVNFLSNALKFAPGRPVTISASPMLEGDPAAPRVQFAVHDRGPGIPPEEQDHLFSLFVRGELPQRRGIRGTGIGLATCRLLAERMRGRVGVESAVGRGAVFYLELPMQVPPGGRLPFETQDPIGEVFNLPCLVVDDEEFNRLVLRDLLERLGCRVDEAASAADALRLYGTNAYRVVFVDLDLPDAAPGELLHTLRRTRPLDGVPPPALVVTTAYATENVRHTCLQAGAFDFLAKPLGTARLADVLRRIDTRMRPAAGVEISASDPAPESRMETLRRLASARRGSVTDLVEDVANDLGLEAGALQDAALARDPRRCAHHAHRLLSLAALLSAPALTRSAGEAQTSARRGEVPSSEVIAAVASAVRELRASLSALGHADAQSSQTPFPTRSE